MYQQKTPKGQLPDKGVYTTIHCHTTIEPIAWYTRTDYYKIFSIDPGKRNFCFRLEKRDLVTGRITMEVFEKIDLLGHNFSEKTPIDYIYRNSITILNKYLDLIKDCHVIIIERQLQVNYQMVRFSQHLITYLSLILRDNVNKTVILEINPTVKTQELKAPKGLNKRETKNWAVQKADELLRIRGDNSSLQILKKAKSKKDDLSDTVVQIEAVFHMFKLPLTPENSFGPIDPVVLPKNLLYNNKNSVGVRLPEINPNINGPLILPEIKNEYIHPIIIPNINYNIMPNINIETLNIKNLNIGNLNGSFLPSLDSKKDVNNSTSNIDIKSIDMSKMSFLVPI